MLTYKQWSKPNPLQTEYPTIYQGFAGAYASLIQTGNPNTNKLTNSSEAAVPNIRTGNEWVIAMSGFTTTKIERLKERCGFWMHVAGNVPIWVDRRDVDNKSQNTLRRRIWCICLPCLDRLANTKSSIITVLIISLHLSFSSVFLVLYTNPNPGSSYPFGLTTP